MTSFKIRKAKKEDLSWINSRYDEVEFKHSEFDQEIIAVAEIDGQRTGLGRLVKLDEKHFELGGMYVLASFRGQGIANEIVKFLLSQINSQQIVYCIPFSHLLDFYKKYGFKECVNCNSVPNEIREKIQWCQRKYSCSIDLLVHQLE